MMAKNNGRKRDSLHWRADKECGFVNPYNFVRLGEGVHRSSFSPDTKELLTGSLSCSLIAKTPIAIPDFSFLTEDEKGGLVHKGSDQPVPFMRVIGEDGKLQPVIPGSEIRGVIRSAFEAVDNGCLSVNNSNIASARHPFPRNPGVLVYNAATRSWTLYKAKKWTVKQDENNSPNGKIRTWKAAPNNRGRTRFVRLGEIVDAVNIEQAVEDYFVSLDIYCENDEAFAQFKNNRSQKGEKLWSTVQRPENCADGDEFPVFYEIVENISTKEQVVYLSPAQISRSVSKNRIDDLLGGDSPSSYKHCSDPDNACEACWLFGMASERGALSSRLRFTDAKPEDGCGMGFRNVTLKELSGPKTSAVEFYTERPDGSLTWTYDYMTTSYRSYRQQGSKPRTEPERSLLIGNDEVKLRGRKFYLHHYHEGGNAAVDKAILSNCSTDERTPRNMTVEVALSGSSFKFAVFFDGITRTQLDKLIWTLCIGQNERLDTHMHKLGHGKPLGLGSVKITVDDITLRTFSESYEVSIEHNVEPKKSGQLFGEGNLPVRDFLVISNYELTKGLHVSYPVADARPYAGSRKSPNDQASHQWFIANRCYGPDSKNNFMPDIGYTLPHLPESAAGGSTLQLPRFIKDSAERLSRNDIERITKPQVFDAPNEEGEEVLTPMQKAMRAAGLI